MRDLSGPRRKYLSAGGIIKTPISYPVYLSKYEDERPWFSESTGIAGLCSIGRNAECAHPGGGCLLAYAQAKAAGEAVGNP